MDLGRKGRDQDGFGGLSHPQVVRKGLESQAPAIGLWPEPLTWSSQMVAAKPAKLQRVPGTLMMEAGKLDPLRPLEMQAGGGSL